MGRSGAVRFKLVKCSGWDLEVLFWEMNDIIHDPALFQLVPSFWRACADALDSNILGICSMVRWFGAASGLAVCLVLAGCGGGVSDKPTMGKVSGVVTLEGKPVAGATIEFNPDNSRSTTGPRSSAVTDANGKYTMMGPGGEEGAVIGFHKVTVSCPPIPGENSSSDSGTPATTPTTPCSVPEKFGKLETTDVTKEVMAGKNDIAIDLKP